MPTQRAARTSVVLATAAYLGSLVPGVRPPGGASTFWDVGVYTAVPLGAAIVCVLRALRSSRDRLAWILIAVGLASYAVGTLLYNAMLRVVADPPNPSIADAFWLLLYPMVIAGLGLMVKRRMTGFALSMWMDGLVSGLGLASLSAALVFPRVTAQATGTPSAIVTNFAYPVLDLALVATVAGGMAALGTWRDRSWLLLGAGFLAFSTADSWYLLQVASDSYRQGSLVDATYLVAIALVALSSADRGDPRSATPAATADETGSPPGRSFLVPGLFALASIGVLASNARNSSMVVAIVLAVAALTAAWVRTALTVREVVLLADSRRQALTDALTGLPNRRAFYDILAAAEHGVGGVAPSVASVLIADLDRFKEINDAVGHQLGDQLLRAVSRRFASLVPPGGTIARLGGDEMALLVPGMGGDDAGALSRRLLASLDEPFVLQGLSLHLNASIGITVVDSGSRLTQALAKADLAMYRAKASHSGWEIYDDDRDGDAWDRLATGEDLRQALASGGLTVEFQPIGTLPEARPGGMEALVRWNHPTRGRVAPDSFLPLAETAGLMSAITRTVLDLSLDEAVALREHGWVYPVSVNLSASDLLDDALVDDIATALQLRHLPGDALRLEITESLLVDTGAGAIERLYRLRELGITIAVDDYGTGYSCLAYLHDLPVSHLKIDRSFVDRVLRDERTAIIVASTIEMAHGLGLKVVAEGVETPEQQRWLAEHDCDYIQGWHLSRPMTAGAMHRWLESRQEHADRRALAASE